MEGAVRGDIVVIPFPFSDLSGAKKRPALAISDMIGDDIVLCQITASRNDDNSVEVIEDDCCGGSLPQTSYVRCHKIFTADVTMIKRIVCTLNEEKMRNVEEKVVSVLGLGR